MASPNLMDVKPMATKKKRVYKEGDKKLKAKLEASDGEAPMKHRSPKEVRKAMYGSKE